MNASLYKNFSLKRIIEPPVAPVSLAEVKTYLRTPDSGDTAEDARLTSMIAAVVEWAEAYTMRAFVQQTWRLRFDCTPYNVIRLPRPPLIVIEEISYIDTAGDTLIIDSADYVVNADDEPAKLARATNAGCWPSANWQPGAYSFLYTAGYAPTEDSPPDYTVNIPDSIKNAILIYLYEWYWNCGGKENCAVLCAVPAAAKNLLSPLRVHWIA